jgi:carbon monoxide dehydrogenase subunit G
LLLLASTGAAAEPPRIDTDLLPVTLRDSDWRDIEQGRTFIHLSEEPGSAVKKGVAIAVIDQDSERVFRVVTDNEHFAEFMPWVKISTVETGTDGSAINHQELDLPFVKDREFKVRISNSVTERDGEQIWRSAWTHVKGFGNIEDTTGSWTLLEYGENRTLVIYEVLTDPGGSIPRFLKNLATKRTLPDLLDSVRQRARDPRYASDL